MTQPVIPLCFDCVHNRGVNCTLNFPSFPSRLICTGQTKKGTPSTAMGGEIKIYSDTNSNRMLKYALF